MAIDSYVVFIPYNGTPLVAESQVDMTNNTEALAVEDLVGYSKNQQLFEVEDYSFDVEQILNIGSQSTGAGAGKITFNPYSITRKIDKASPTLFDMACSGTAFKQVILALRKSTGQASAVTSGTATSGQIFLRFDFKLVAVKTISWSHDDESPKETVTFEYGGLLIRYCQQNPDGTLKSPIPGGWNRVANKQDHTTNPIT
jgi:type VI protein secretion system component Hcp